MILDGDKAIPETTREVLELIENFAKHIQGKKESSRDLWNILAALRGPDSDDFTLKLQTTAHIRAAALPCLARSNGAYANQGTHWKYRSYEEPTYKTKGSSGHFASHIFCAVNALKELGLWDSRDIPSDHADQ